MKTTDDSSYYRRHAPGKKADMIRAFIAAHEPIKSVYDVGCNMGAMSVPYLSEGKIVSGLDLSTDLILPPNYQFRYADVVKDTQVVFADCTFFLSLYHHLLGAYGLATADRVFYQLLLRTKYLIFDTGNVSETERSNALWYTAQLRHFKTEKALLDHFKIPYTKLGVWTVAGGTRTVVVFQSALFDRCAQLLDEYRRKGGRNYQAEGLFSIKKHPKLSTVTAYTKAGDFYHGTCFSKLQLGNRLFFAKKHVITRHAQKELANIVLAYASLPPELLITFYGVSKTYGFIYEWLPKFTYAGKRACVINKVTLPDADILIVNGQQKLIDFFTPIWKEPNDQIQSGLYD